LLFPRQRVLERAIELVANHVGVRRRCRTLAGGIRAVASPQVEHVDLRQSSATHTFGKIQQSVFAGRRVGPALE
jgi:hypothetical protein